MTEQPPSPPLQFVIVLAESDPLIWRRILVPASYSFWDLHVAIQDAMGWTDTHLHEFLVLRRDSLRGMRIGIPDEDFPKERPCKPGWKVEISEYFSHSGAVAEYLYDFGDGWAHSVLSEGFAYDERDLPAPRCIGGANACPPEDCGGMHGYRNFLEAISDRRHPDHRRLLTWVGGSFEPLAFDPAAVRFDDPNVRFRRAFS